MSTSSRRFVGQTVLITGASLGVGRAVAHAFHAEGANVVMVARRVGPLEEAAKGMDRALCIAADVADLSALAGLVERSVAHFGALDGVVNNAGLHHRGLVERNAAEDLAAMVDVNLRAPIALTRLALPHLLARRGFAVQVASLAGKVPLDGAATYSATKFGLRAFSIALAQEVGSARGAGEPREPRGPSTRASSWTRSIASKTSCSARRCAPRMTSPAWCSTARSTDASSVLSAQST